LTSLSIGSAEGLVGSIAFIFHYSLIGLLLMLICSYMSYNFDTCNIKNLHYLKEGGVLIQYFFKLSIPFICSFPLTFLFLANWQLAYVSLDFSYLIIILIPMITTFFVFANLAVKMMSYFYFDSSGVNKPRCLNDLQDNIYYLICFILTILVILLFAANPKITLDIFRNLSLYLT
jgi:formate hydrogenlyase subunit 3/multisubunit Na+/H+ antiporter MnhD subunit